MRKLVNDVIISQLKYKITTIWMQRVASKGQIISLCIKYNDHQLSLITSHYCVQGKQLCQKLIKFAISNPKQALYNIW